MASFFEADFGEAAHALLEDGGWWHGHEFGAQQARSFGAVLGLGRERGADGGDLQTGREAGDQVATQSQVGVDRGRTRRSCRLARDAYRHLDLDDRVDELVEGRGEAQLEQGVLAAT